MYTLSYYTNQTPCLGNLAKQLKWIQDHNIYQGNNRDSLILPYVWIFQLYFPS